MEFNEDPFKDANHRYGDPFDLEGADPFAGNQEDPFTAPVTAAFGAAGSTPEVDKQLTGGNSPFSNQADPFAPLSSPATAANYSNNENDPFGGTTWDTLSKTSSSTTPEVNKQLTGSAWSTTPEIHKQLTGSAWGAMTSTTVASDPFGNNNVVPVSNNLDDSFDPFSAKSLAKSSPMTTSSATKADDPFGRPAAVFPPEVPTDPFGSSSAWKSEATSTSHQHDPFSAVPVTRSKTSSDAFADFRNNTTTPKISSSTGTGSGLPPPNKTLNPLQKSETTASMLNKTSQSLSRPWSSSNSKADPFGSSSTTGSGSTSSIPRSRPSASSSHQSSGLDLDISNNKKSKGMSGGNFKMFPRVPFVSKKNKEKSSGGGSKVIKNDLGGGTTPSAPPAATSPTSTSAGSAPMDTFHLQMASEASKKAELDRVERLRQQEERDLAYAIALSKAEAANQ